MESLQSWICKVEKNHQLSDFHLTFQNFTVYYALRYNDLGHGNYLMGKDDNVKTKVVHNAMSVLIDGLLACEEYYFMVQITSPTYRGPISQIAQERTAFGRCRAGREGGRGMAWVVYIWDGRVGAGCTWELVGCMLWGGGISMAKCKTAVAPVH